MSKFGWAYVNDIITGSGGTPGGSDKAIQFASGSTFSGSTNFTFDYTTNIVRLTGTLYADNLIVSSSTIFKSGSTKFGDDATDTHQFTGSIFNTVLVSGTLAAFTTITGSTITSNLITGSSLVISASVISASTYLGISVPTASGGNKAIQFASGSTFSGSTNFTFDYTTNVLSLTGTTLISGSLTTTNTITATSASFLDYVQLGTSLSDEAYFNASLKTNIQPAATNDVDLGASSRFWRTGYITTLSSSAISSSVSVKTGEITATAIVLNGNLSSSGNINGSGLQISGGGSFGSTVTVTGSVSASVNLQTAGDITAGTNLTVNNFAIIKNGLTVTGSSIITGSLTVIGIMSANSISGDGNNITGINGANVNGVGDDWTIQFKDGNTGTLTGSSNLTFSWSTFILSGNLNVTGAIKGGYATYSANTSIPNTSYFVGLNSVSSVLTASLLAATKYPQGQTLIFKDIGGYAGTNNILVKASGSETIDGASGVSLTTNSSSVSIISNGSNGFYIVGIV